ncbi:MAG: hypothetical protein WCW31_02790 [Patescibacteria group bacterium]
MGKRTDYAALRAGFGLARGLSDEFIQACERINPPIEAIHRLVTPNGQKTMDEIVRRAVADWQAEQPKPEAITNGAHPYRGGTPIRRVEFVAPVVYTIPAMDELKRRFSGYVNPAYEGIAFEPIKVCEKVSRETCEVEFEYVHLGHDASNDEVLAEIDKRGLRPALPEELLGFAEKYPDEQLKHPIVALGSVTSVDGDRRVAYLWGDGDGRGLRLGWVDFDWSGDYRFLAVRKVSS